MCNSGDCVRGVGCSATGCSVEWCSYKSGSGNYAERLLTRE